MDEADATWDDAIARFTDAATTDAGRTYLMLLDSAKSRWESSVAIHPWRLDVLDLTSRADPGQSVQAEYRVRAGQPIMIFRLGPSGRLDAKPAVAGDVCQLDKAPVVLDAFLLQIAEPAS